MIHFTLATGTTIWLARAIRYRRRCTPVGYQLGGEPMTAAELIAYIAENFGDGDEVTVTDLTEILAP